MNLEEEYVLAEKWNKAKTRRRPIRAWEGGREGGSREKKRLSVERQRKGCRARERGRAMGTELLKLHGRR